MPLPLKRCFLVALVFCLFLPAFAATVSGTVTDENAAPLSFSSLTVKGGSKGVIANSQGRYVLDLEPGEYTLVCHHVGYRVEERTIRLGLQNLVVNFQLHLQDLSMPEIVIRRGGDPALEIMQKAIGKRGEYNRQVESFTVDVYIKGLVRSLAMPERMIGQRADKKEMEKQGLDSAGKGILFLSESLTKVAYQHPDKIRMEVVSSRQSGGGFGLSVPFFVNFYINNVQLFDGSIAPRGFVSPLADAAFHYYSFRYEGNFFEGDKMIDRIRVRPRRKNEPLFDGFLQIVDGEWRIHSLSLVTDKSHGLDLLDTVRITQRHAPVTANVWRTQDQVLSFTAKVFGFELSGDFLNVYSHYDFSPGFPKKFFNRVLMKFDTAFNQRDSTYWSRLRSVPLTPEEMKDFRLKDSLRKQDHDSLFANGHLDSLRKAQKTLKPLDLFQHGISRRFHDSSAWKEYRSEPLLRGLEYNIVEGVSLSALQSLAIHPKTGKNDMEIGWNTRYGFQNKHLNMDGSFTLRPKGEAYRGRFFRFSGGKRLFQFNQEAPVDEFTNSIATLFYRRNYWKVYEAWFARGEYNTAFDNGLRLNLDAHYENRTALENSSDFSFFYRERPFTLNHPAELAGIPFLPHAATVFSVQLSYQPGQSYIELPRGKVAVGSPYPTLELHYAKGIPRLFGSVADFDKWKLSVFDEANWKLWGLFKYRVSIGGFLNSRRVDIPDFTHFNGNQTLFNFNYVNSFQLAPYYQYSNAERFYSLLHAEHHFNGLLTNKIPLFNKLKWNLVAGTNTFYVNTNNYYLEAFVGLENIFKVFRVDLVTATQAAPGHSVGVRIGFGGLIGSSIRRSR